MTSGWHLMDILKILDIHSRQTDGMMARKRAVTEEEENSEERIISSYSVFCFKLFQAFGIDGKHFFPYYT